MKPSLDLLSRNFSYEFSPHALDDNGYVACSTADCLSDVEYLLQNQAINALLASWGGKNCNRLVAGLPYTAISQARKCIVGFSDTCSILNAISATTGLITFYGPNIAGKLTESGHYDFGLLQGQAIPPFGRTAGGIWQTITPGETVGRLYGGNLSTFVLALAGSPQMRQMQDPIFFWESASEPPQIVDQHLTCLKNCGFLGRARAMIVGDVQFPETPRNLRPIDDLLGEWGNELNIPVVRITNFGHQRLENPAIPIGAPVFLSTSSKSVQLSAEIVVDV